MHREENESILSHLGSKATLSFMAAVVTFGAVLIAVDVAGTGRDTASTRLGLGDLDTDYAAVNGSDGSGLPGGAVETGTAALAFLE